MLQKAEKFFDGAVRERIDILLKAGIPGGRKDLYKYLHAGYDPRLSKYKQVLSSRILLNIGGDLGFPEDSWLYGAAMDITLAGPENRAWKTIFSTMTCRRCGHWRFCMKNILTRIPKRFSVNVSYGALAR